jgi:hypothetical protein
VPLVAADNAAFLMNTNEFAACGTCPPVLFLFDEISYAELLYVIKIIDHAHPVICFVALVELV